MSDVNPATATTVPSEAAVAVASTDRDPHVAAKKIVMASDLQFVRFHAFSAQTSSYPNPDDVVNLKAAIKFRRPEIDRFDERHFTARTTLVFQLAGEVEGTDGVETLAHLRATFDVQYTLKPEAPEASDDELADFALCYCPFHAWGYWREFVQSSLAKMDLPQVTVQLFRIDMAQKLVQDTVD